MARLEVELDPSGAKKGAREVKRDLRGIADQADTTAVAMGRLGNRSAVAMEKATVSTKVFAAATKRARLGVLALGVAAAAMVRSAFQGARGLDTALSEASTLLQGTTEEMTLMREEAIRLATQFGGSSTEQVNAFYQAISAGSATVEDATVVLTAANKLAVGGVTDVTTAVDVLTSVTNAYAAQGLSAADASDALFIAVKAGKTTVGELAAGLGQVLPFASATGIAFDEVAAAVAALTTQGQTTSLAVTGVRASLGAILKPTSEAAKLAEKLGIEFNVAGLQARGFGGFLEDVREKTNNSQAQMSILFGGLEALTAVLGFAGGAGVVFNDTMDEMAVKAGATDIAFNKVNDSLNKRLERSFTTIIEVAKRFGGFLLSVLVPTLENLITFFGAIADRVNVFRNALDFSGIASFINPINQLETATDNVTIAMGDEIRQSKALEVALGRSSQESVAAAQQKLTEALARRKNVEAIIAEQRALANQSSTAVQLRSDIDLLQAQLRSTPETGVAAAGRENTEQLIVDRLNSLSRLNDINVDLDNQLTRIRGNIAGLEEGLAGATNGMVTYSGSVAEPIALTERLDSVISDLNGSLAKVPETTSAAIPALQEVGDTISNSIGNGIRGLINGTQSLADAFKSMAADVVASLFDVLVTQRLVADAQTLLGGLFGGGGGLLGGLFGGLSTAIGGGLQSPRPTLRPFADGGVINSPTIMPIGGGGMGLAGEAGPEAILPLERGSNGKLGVRSSGGGGDRTVNQHITIQALSDGDVERVLARRAPQLRNMVLQVIQDERIAGGIV